MKSKDNGSAPLRIMHVTESLEGGILDFICDISHFQELEGAKLSVAYIDKSGSTQRLQVAKRFSENTELHMVASTRNRLSTIFHLNHFLKKVLQDGSVDIIHLHSSFAGVAGRLVPSRISKDTKIFYSPHGFSFLKLDSNLIIRKIYLLLERVLSKRKFHLILTSKSEYKLALRSLKPKCSAAILKNGVRSDYLREFPKLARIGKPTVAMIGRICFQKAPWRFSNIASELRGEANFVWIGSRQGDNPAEFGLIGEDIRIIPWTSMDCLIKELEDVDVLLFPTLWEGFSLSIPLAQSRGIPAVVSNIVGNVDAILDGLSGFICNSDSEMIISLRKILSDRALYSSMSKKALEHAGSSLINSEMGIDSIKIYLFNSLS